MKQYSEFIEQVRFNIANDIPEPFTNAIKQAIKNGFLSDYLNRKSTEVQNMLLAEYDYDTDIAVQRRESFEDGFSAGEEHGIAIGEERGISIGRNEGISIGLSQGISQGAYQAKLETAKTLLTFGDSIEKVAKVTGLSVEEIEKL